MNNPKNGLKPLLTCPFSQKSGTWSNLEKKVKIGNLAYTLIKLFIRFASFFCSKVTRAPGFYFLFFIFLNSGENDKNDITTPIHPPIDTNKGRRQMKTIRHTEYDNYSCVAIHDTSLDCLIN